MAMGGMVNEMHDIISEAPESACAPETAIVTSTVLGSSGSMFAIIASHFPVCSVLPSPAL